MELTEDFASIVDFIVRHYKGSKKIVEVGVGRFARISAEIKQRLSETEVIVTDKDQLAIHEIRSRFQDLKAIQDDVMRPNLEIYEGADLIYSIRPPPELWNYLTKLAKKVHCDLLIKPLDDDLDIIPHEFNLVNYESSSFLFRKVNKVAVKTSDASPEIPCYRGGR